mmetsp:Transcript_17402/g.36490  ORF Transcript_17402/g.36490 Transcript_17402/m.36490 type:complete len:230 (+) Transcript_17402:756-1445(+)
MICTLFVRFFIVQSKRTPGRLHCRRRTLLGTLCQTARHTPRKVAILSLGIEQCVPKTFQFSSDLPVIALHVLFAKSAGTGPESRIGGRTGILAIVRFFEQGLRNVFSTRTTAAVSRWVSTDIIHFSAWIPPSPILCRRCRPHGLPRRRASDIFRASDRLRPIAVLSRLVENSVSVAGEIPHVDAVDALDVFDAVRVGFDFEAREGGRGGAGVAFIGVGEVGLRKVKQQW